MKPTPKKKIDPLKPVKYIGYRLSQLPKGYTLNELVKYAKFQLAVTTKRLLKDPIWDEYTAEEILVEFFAHQFQEDEAFRVKFEQEFQDINGVIDDFANWADKQIAQEDKIRKHVQIMGGLEEIDFNPDQIMGEE